MDVEIIGKHANKVQVNTAIGCFIGNWCSPIPADKKRYVVELDSDEVITSDAINISDARNGSIKSINGTVYLVGLVEEIQDKVMILRLQKTIMMLEVSNEFDFTQYIGHYVNVTLGDINLYDTGIY